MMSQSIRLGLFEGVVGVVDEGAVVERSTSTSLASRFEKRSILLGGEPSELGGDPSNG